MGTYFIIIIKTMQIPILNDRDLTVYLKIPTQNFNF